VVELFAVGSLAPDRRAVSAARSSLSPGTSSPRRHRLNDPDWTSQPGTNPLGGFAPSSRITTRGRHHGRPWACPRRPSSVGSQSDRTPGLVLEEGTPLQNSKGLLRRASVEPDERLSTHPALRAHIRRGWLGRALMAAGEAALAGGVVRHDGVSTALASLTTVT
jgi:hypothetical protein